MRRYVARNSAGDAYLIHGTLDARHRFEKARDGIGMYLTVLPFLFLFSPLFFIVVAIFGFMYYRREIYDVFFVHKEVTAKYMTLFEPLVSKTLFSVVGYRVYPEELQEHLQIINSDEKEDLKKLAKKGERMRRNMTRQFGFNTDRMTRHAIFLGTTGAGKTETIMSFFIDVIKGAGGVGMIDGKSDQPMEFKIYNLCKENYYETQFYAIILNKPEEGTESNTYSPLLSYNSALKASEFLGAFISGGEGNADYFANRGKVMLGNIVMHFKNRQKYYGENFTLADLSRGYSPIEMNNIYYLSYCINRDIEELIAKHVDDNLSFARLMERARGMKTATLMELENCELLNEFLNQSVHLIKEVENILGIKFDFINNYYILFSLIDEYMEGISPTWKKYAKSIAESVYIAFKKDKKNFLYNVASPVSMRDVRNYYDGLKNIEGEEFATITKYYQSRKEFSGKLDALKEAMGLVEGGGENVEKISNDAMQQHQYATQQWGRLFGLFREYSRITGVPYPDVDGEDIIKNNKVLYVMLPVTELESDQVSMLGRMFILMFKNIASIALGGDKQSATPIQFKIYQNRLKPNPVFLMVLDEVGAYMISGLSIIASQVRSLSISLILSGQDSVSVMPEGGDGKREQARLLANLAKIVLQNRDADTHEFEKMISEIEIAESEGLVHSAISNRAIASKKLSIKKVRNFDIAQSSRFAKGFGVYIDGARDEPTYFQSYYVGDNAYNPSQIRKFEAFKNLYLDY